MNDRNNSGPENAWKELRSAFEGILSWKWDSRFETVSAEFAAGKKENIRAILERSLGITWDSSNIGNAPDVVREIDSHFGGLRSGQLLFTSDPEREPVIFCAWWPWGSGKTISIRIGSSRRKLSDSEKAGKIQLLRKEFGI
jgi:hypothetical protein